MKHFVFTLAFAAAFAAAVSSGASAQTVSSPENLSHESAAPTVKRSGDVLVVDGRKLTGAETLDYISGHCGGQYAGSWSKGARVYGVGKGLLISSAVTIPVGVAGMTVGMVKITAGAVGGSIGSAISGSSEIAPEERETINKGAVWLIGGTIVAAVGISTVIAGAVCLPVGKSRMNSVVNRCNAAGQGAEITMNFGSCPHGLGMTLNF